MKNESFEFYVQNSRNLYTSEPTTFNIKINIRTNWVRNIKKANIFLTAAKNNLPVLVRSGGFEPPRIYIR